MPHYWERLIEPEYSRVTRPPFAFSRQAEPPSMTPPHFLLQIFLFSSQFSLFRFRFLIAAAEIAPYFLRRRRRFQPMIVFRLPSPPPPSPTRSAPPAFARLRRRLLRRLSFLADTLSTRPLRLYVSPVASASRAAASCRHFTIETPYATPLLSATQLSHDYAVISY